MIEECSSALSDLFMSKLLLPFDQSVIEFSALVSSFSKVLIQFTSCLSSLDSPMVNYRADKRERELMLSHATRVVSNEVRVVPVRFGANQPRLEEEYYVKR